MTTIRMNTATPLTLRNIQVFVGILSFVCRNTDGSVAVVFGPISLLYASSVE